MSQLLKWYRKPGLQAGEKLRIFKKLEKALKECSTTLVLKSLDTECCFYVELEAGKELSPEDEKNIEWILSVPFEERNLWHESHFPSGNIIEVGPRLNFTTPFSTNAVSICASVGLKQVRRIECSTRYLFGIEDPEGAAEKASSVIQSVLIDFQTQMRYHEPLENFQSGASVKPEETYDVDVMGEGRAALERVNRDMGLALDDADLKHYTELFQQKLQRNPTNVEFFDLAQSNSEHSRHWFFQGRLVVDGEEKPKSLFKMVKATQEHSNQNNVIKFSDNSSAIEGYEIEALYPENQTEASFFKAEKVTRHIVFTAETHNFPTGVAPFPGATTGTGGRIRDVQATGRGAHVIAGTAGYCFGNLYINDYEQPWEGNHRSLTPEGMSSPLQIAIEASNGASDYGNKFGEPVLTGFARSFGMKIRGEMISYAKPIMFSGGIGSIESIHVTKDEPYTGEKVIKIGGPVYRIGVGGGAASSFGVQGDNDQSRDLNAVQRGDPEMEQKMNRIIRACIERKEKNPIHSIHDQGAGGNGNVLKEICYPSGAKIFIKNFQLGDPTLSELEIWGAEYQESNAALIDPKNEQLLTALSAREKCPVSFVGTISGDGKIILTDEDPEGEKSGPAAKQVKKKNPVDLDLEQVLGEMPKKVFELDHAKDWLERSPLNLPENLLVRAALDRVLRLPSVASKRYLTNKVDRSVTGLVAQQQCVGPLHTPLADVAVVALSILNKDYRGAATSVGEQPIKGLVNTAVGARMAVAEALSNLALANVSDLKDVKCSGNWMWAAKLPGEGALLHDACRAMCDVMAELGIAVDGGKDSLSMAARVDGKTVKAPGTLVISTYVGCPRIDNTLTPDFKCVNGEGVIVHIAPCGEKKYRLGGSALAQCYEQIGDSAPDLDDATAFASAFSTMQRGVKDEIFVSGHDISDGGLITCLLEMAFAGNCGCDVEISTSNANSIEALFNEEIGWLVEVSPSELEQLSEPKPDVTVTVIGHVRGKGKDAKVVVRHNGSVVLDEPMVELRDAWEETSFKLELLQANPECVLAEQQGMKDRKDPPYHLTFNVDSFSRDGLFFHPKVAVIREEGSNGDREMVAAFHMAGFEAWDVNMQDLCSGSITLDQFSGVAFVGGFSYADVMGSAKGWAATSRLNSKARHELDAFYRREDTFSLGVCNGCQLMTTLGWVGEDVSQKTPDGGRCQGVHLTHNSSGRFESRFSTVSIQDSPAIMLKGMAGSTLGIWVAHGEGRMVFKESQVLKDVQSYNLAPVRYVDDDGMPTTQYPFNPNGSPEGIAALCSKNGRHLAIMPHPERCVLPWQWAWQPPEWKKTCRAPWMKMFYNAYNWCIQTQSK